MYKIITKFVYKIYNIVCRINNMCRILKCLRVKVFIIISVAATGKGGGCVLASATAHVAEPQHTLSLYYPLFTNRSFYQRIPPTSKGI